MDKRPRDEFKQNQPRHTGTQSQKDKGRKDAFPEMEGRETEREMRRHRRPQGQTGTKGRGVTETGEKDALAMGTRGQTGTGASSQGRRAGVRQTEASEEGALEAAKGGEGRHQKDQRDRKEEGGVVERAEEEEAREEDEAVRGSVGGQEGRGQGVDSPGLAAQHPPFPPTQQAPGASRLHKTIFPWGMLMRPAIFASPGLWFAYICIPWEN